MSWQLGPKLWRMARNRFTLRLDYAVYMYTIGTHLSLFEHSLAIDCHMYVHGNWAFLAN